MSKVSIIMPAYNNEDYIVQAIESVISQSYSDWELIIVDDCSTDSTYKLAKKMSKLDRRISVFKLESNSGSPSAPRNLAIEKSTGEYLAFLDSDDLWKKEKLDIQIKYMIDNSVMFSYSSFDIINSEGDYLYTYYPHKRSMNYDELLIDNIIGCLTAVVKKSIVKSDFIDAGHEDFAFWLSILKNGEKAYLCSSKPLSLYRVVGESRSSNKINAIVSLFNLYYRIEGYNYISTVVKMAKFIINFRTRKNMYIDASRK